MGIKITGIGGLPFSNHQQAWEWALKFDLAFRPELPIYYPQESLLGQLQCWPKNPFPSISESIGNKLKMRKIALHYPGPDVRAFLSTPMDLEDYVQFLFQRWQQDQAEMLDWQATAVLFLDMPNWRQWELQHPEELIFWQYFNQQVKGEWGIHCCGRFDIENVMKASAHFLSFDYMSMLQSDPYVVGELLKLGNKINLIFGVINSLGQTLSSEQIMALAKVNSTKNELWLSPTCGLSGAKDDLPSLIYSFLSGF